MKLYVVRHCTTEFSAKKIYCGSTDAPLNEEGRREVVSLSEALSAHPLDAIYSSPLLRARETAEGIALGRGIPVFYDERLRERDFGEFEGKSCALAEGKRFRYSFALRYPGGESNLFLASRIYSFLDELLTHREYRSVAVVSHGSACRLIRTYFREMTDEEFYAYSQPNGKVEVYEG